MLSTVSSSRCTSTVITERHRQPGSTLAAVRPSPGAAGEQFAAVLFALTWFAVR